MSDKTFALVLVACGLVLAESSAIAHHAFTAEFDATKHITLTGTVTKIEWQNPHTYFYIDVKDDSDKVTNWGLEMGSPNLLIRAGLNRNSMKIGDLVTVEGFPAKNGSNVGNAQVVTFTTSGKTLFNGSSPGVPAP